MNDISLEWVPRALFGAVCVGAIVWYLHSSDVPPADDLSVPLPAFTLTDQAGQSVTREDLLGKVWVASFVFTRCYGPCPAVTATMARLQQAFADQPNVMLVTISVDPEHDTPAVLARYADTYNAYPDRWLFLTGKPEVVYRLLQDGFHVAAQPNRGEARTPGNEVMHSTRLAVVDKHGNIRGYYNGTPDVQRDGEGQEFNKDLRAVQAKVATLLREEP